MARELNNRAREFVGIDQRIWVLLETGGFGDAATGGLIPAATDAIEHVTAKIDFNIPREAAAHRSGRSVVTRLSGKKEAKVSFESYIVPSDPDGSDHPTLPDAHPMLLTAFGTVDQTDVTKVIYKLARAGSQSFRMLEEGTHFSRLAVGCVMDTVTFSLPGDGKAMMKMEGFAQDVYACGETTLSANSVASNSLTLQVGHGKRFQINGYADVIQAADGSTRIASSRKITNIVGDVLTVSGAVITAAIGDIVIGAAPDYTATPSANALLGLKGTFSTANLGTVNCDLLSAEISLKNNFTPRANAYGTSAICGYMSDKRREVTIKLEILLTKANYEFYSSNKQFVADNLTITLAPQDIPAPVNAALGRTFTFKLPKVEFNVPGIEQPGDGFVKLSLEGTALSTDINTQNAEMTLEIA